MKAYRGSRGIAAPILCLSTRWRWVVTIMPCSLFAQERTAVPNEYEAEWAPEPA